MLTIPWEKFSRHRERKPHSAKTDEAVIRTLAEFAIFNDLGEGTEPQLIASVSAFESAKSVMEEAATKSPGRYFVWDSSEGQVVARLTAD